MKHARFSIITGTVLLTLAFLAQLGAWITELRGAPLLGLSQGHLFSDAAVLALLGIAGLLDGLIHLREGVSHADLGAACRSTGLSPAVAVTPPSSLHSG